MRRRRWREQAYREGKRWLHRLRLQAWMDYSYCSILLSERRGLPPSAWDADSLWLGEVRAAQADWVAALAPRRRQEFEQRWRDGLRCFAAGLDQRCVGFVWVAVGPAVTRASASGFAWNVPAGAAWLLDGLVHPLVLGTYPDLVRFATLRLRDEGSHKIFGRVEFDNRLSQRVHAMLGAGKVGWVAMLRCGGVQVRVDRTPNSFRLRWGRQPADLAGFLPATAPAVAVLRKSA